MKRLSISLAFLLLGCSTASQQRLSLALVAAKPIADAAIAAAASHYGVSPTTTQAGIAAFDQLSGMAAQQFAGQPAAQGASIPAVGSAVTPLLTSNTDSNAALLTLAAQLIQSKAGK